MRRPLAAASAAQHLGGGAHQGSGTDALVTGTGIGGHHHDRARADDRTDGDDGGLGVTESAAGVEDQRAYGVG